MSILDRLPRRPSCTAHLDADHAHLLLDALALAERMIELRVSARTRDTGPATPPASTLEVSEAGR
jgi:hypothetical protein